MKTALLVLEDGKFFPGRAFGRDGETIGEVVFNTALFGFQETLTDPTSAGRLVAFTANVVGAAGVNDRDMESASASARGVIVRSLSRVASNFRSRATLDEFCAEQGVVGITDVDSRALTAHIRDEGPKMGIIAHGASVDDVDALVARVKAAKRHESEDFSDIGVQKISTATLRETQDNFQPYVVEIQEGVPAAGENEVVVIDLGATNTLLKQVAQAGYQVTLVPASTGAEAILARKPKSVLVSSGPGNPNLRGDVVQTVQALLGKVTVVGVGLGCQIAALALGGEAPRVASPNLGANIPVRRERDQLCGVVAHNHTWSVRFPEAPAGLEVSYSNVTTGAVEGFDLASKSVYGVQHIPTDAKLTEALSSSIA